MRYQRLISTISILYFSVTFLHASDIDSIGIKKEEGEIFVLHRVDAQETLYSLSRRYGASIDAIVENNQITGNSLSVGTVLSIPWQHAVTHTVKAGETLYSISKLYTVSQEQIKEANSLKGNQLEIGMILTIVSKVKTSVNSGNLPIATDQHVVGNSETLYSISKKYGVSLQELKAWNSLQNNNVQVGDTLSLIQIPESSKLALPSDENSNLGITSTSTVFSPANQEVSSTPSTNREINRSVDVVPVKENGIAAVIDGNSETKKYLALHRTASVGTIMRVRNEMTNLSVFVRVVGKLPDTGSNNNVLLRLSQAAQEALGALDGKFRVEVSYVPNQ